MPNLTFSLRGESDVAIAFCTLGNGDHCTCSTCMNWLKCETQRIGDSDWTYGYIRLKPGATDSYRICNRHIMVACIKYFSSLKSMTVDDFNLVVTSEVGNTKVAVIAEDTSEFGIVEIMNDANEMVVSNSKTRDIDDSIDVANGLIFTAGNLLDLITTVFSG
ncbi:hypothetical protein HDU99_000905 [Rhizoclosmatium hyalinum]|nr:hypothetical protein HDU99_000905 [Rhizoclosmatium hyalinum]